ncbi:MAG: hemerythrin domain-containing protein [Planctomycetota bacterium]|jgi:iron-sulfur cluster repair protein YtfE (RIC family)
MKDVLKIMDKEHEGLESLFDQILIHIKNNSDQSIEIFSEFKRNLQKHFQWEEKILFPLFEERAGLAGADTTFVLKNEHIQIKNMFINKIEVILNEKKYSDITLLLIGLEEMLRMHRNMETDIFYPWFDDSLGVAEKERVLKILKNRDNN